MMRGRHEEALAALRGRHLDAELELYRAWAVFDDGDVEDAAESSTLATLAAAALRADRLLGFGYYVLGRIAEREGRFADATRAFKRAAQLSPQHRDARRREHLLLRHGKGR
jgi:Flp pilus assembly protein TadD